MSVEPELPSEPEDFRTWDPPPQAATRATENALHEEIEEHRKQAEDLFAMIANGISKGEPSVIESYFKNILSLPLSDDLQERALFEFATYLDENKVNLNKAAAVYENFITLAPTSTKVPLVNLRLAEIYRQLGAEKRSLNKLYEVLSASIRAGGDSKNESHTREAMLKIGNTHFEAGQYEQAASIYSRLKLLDLSPEDQAFVLFRATELLFRMKHYEPAIEAGRQFLAQYPASEFALACQQMIVQSLDASGHEDEAIQETLELLRSTQKNPAADQALASYWKIKTGNDLANVLYSRGEFLRALHMYQTLANINTDPTWKLSTVYQIGLCFERLQEPRRAIEAYRYIVDAKISEKDASKDAGKRISAKHVKEAAAWRARHLEWAIDVGTKLYPILSSKIRPLKPLPDDAKE